MAYARFGSDCRWYIFWSATKQDEEYERVGTPTIKSAETLAIWHADHIALNPLFNYVEVSEMLKEGDFSRIPGYSEADKDLIVECLIWFVEDVDQKYSTDRIGSID
jgi:hypothetical protein